LATMKPWVGQGKGTAVRAENGRPGPRWQGQLPGPRVPRPSTRAGRWGWHRGCGDSAMRPKPLPSLWPSPSAPFAHVAAVFARVIETRIWAEHTRAEARRLRRKALRIRAGTRGSHQGHPPAAPAVASDAPA
jgi:hypothetical protein